MKEFHLLTLIITSACNRRCPSCTFAVADRGAQHWGVEHFMQLAPLVGHVKRLCVSGGEPLLHPHLNAVVGAIAAVYSRDELLLATNGDLLHRHPGIVPFFDAIRVPVLGEHTYPGCPSNAQALALARTMCAGRTRLAEQPTVHWTRPGLASRDCANAYTTSICWDGVVYPCCMPIGQGVRLVPGVDWRAEVCKLPVPCDRCNLASAADVARAQRLRLGDGVAGA